LKVLSRNCSKPERIKGDGGVVVIVKVASCHRNIHCALVQATMHQRKVDRRRKGVVAYKKDLPLKKKELCKRVIALSTLLVERMVPQPEKPRLEMPMKVLFMFNSSRTVNPPFVH